MHLQRIPSTSITVLIAQDQLARFIYCKELKCYYRKQFPTYRSKHCPGMCFIELFNIAISMNLSSSNMLSKAFSELLRAQVKPLLFPDLCPKNQTNTLNPCLKPGKCVPHETGHNIKENINTPACSAPLALLDTDFSCTCPHSSRYVWNAPERSPTQSTQKASPVRPSQMAGATSSDRIAPDDKRNTLIIIIASAVLFFFILIVSANAIICVVYVMQCFMSSNI